MKYIVLVPDGMADEPVAELGGKTPLEAAQTPNMDFMVQNGLSGLVKTIPDGMPPGSDVGNLALLGYDPRENYSGRAPLEAANMGIMLKDDEVAFRCNLVTINDQVMIDYSAGHITTEEALLLIEELNRRIDWPDVRFYVGKSYRHLMVVKALSKERFFEAKCVPPHDIAGKRVEEYLPKGGQSEMLLKLMTMASVHLEEHPVNMARREMGEQPANRIWLWGQGGRPSLPLFKDKFGLSGSIISAVDLVNGIGRLAGLDVITVPGATGYYDTDYRAKANYAIASLKAKDYVYVHVEAPDEAGHNGDYKAKKESIERFDQELVKIVLDYAKSKSDVRVLVSPDHPTPVVKRTHTREPVCFAMWGKGVESNHLPELSESAAKKEGIKFQSGEDMIKVFLNHQKS